MTLFYAVVERLNFATSLYFSSFPSRQQSLLLRVTLICRLTLYLVVEYFVCFAFDSVNDMLKKSKKEEKKSQIPTFYLLT